MGHIQRTVETKKLETYENRGRGRNTDNLTKVIEIA